MNILVVVLASGLVSAAPPVFTAKTIDGRQVRGALSDWDEQSLTLQEGAEHKTLLLEQLLLASPTRTSSIPSSSSAIKVALLDGSVVAAESYLAEANSAKISTRRTGILTVPLTSVDHIRFRELSTDLQKRWNELLEKGIDQDMLVIMSGGTLDYLGGVVRSVREQEVDFELDGDVLPVRRSKVFALRYYRPDRGESAEPLAHLTDDAGSTWSLQHVKFPGAEGKIEAEAGDGLQLTLPLDAISRIDFAGAGLVYLTDLAVHSYRWTPYFGEEGTIPSLKELYRPRSDSALDSSPIQLDGIQYERGLSLHSRTEITYRLPESFKRFQALAGIDDRLRPRGNVHLRILGDDRVLYEATISGMDSSLPIDVSLKGVRTLTILADFGADLDQGDHLLLAEAKLLK